MRRTRAYVRQAPEGPSFHNVGMGQHVPRPLSESFDLGKLLPFVGMHVMALVGLLVFPPTVELVALAALLYVVRMLGITVGYHRYFSHHAFRTSRPVQFALACWANLSLMRGPIPWVVAHRHHHRFADQSQDPHSPRRGFLWSHMGWFLSKESSALDMAPARDLEGFPELRALSQWYVVPTVVLFLALAWAGGWAWVVWGGPVSLVAAWHGTFAINSFGHGPSRLRRFATNDDSRNSFLLAVLTCGEGWHNNHHHRMGLARHGLTWWEVDLSYGVICFLEVLGLVWDVRRPGVEASTTIAAREKAPAVPVPAEANTPSPVVETYRKPSPSLA